MTSRSNVMRVCGVTVALLLTATPAATAAYSDDVLATPGLVAYWRLGETAGTTAQDAAAGAHTGTYVNGPSLGAGALISGADDRAAAFDGVNDYVTVPDADALDVSTGATLEVWLSLDAIVSGGQSVLSKGSGYVLRVTTGGAVRATWYEPGTSTDMSTTQTLHPGRIHHVVATYAAGGERRIYIDGQLALALPAGGALRATATPVNLSSTIQPLDGTLDDVAVYNQALDASQISAHWDAGRDATAPQVTFDSGPSARVAATDAAFAFHADDTGSTLRCRVDGGSWSGCAGTLNLTSLSEGAHSVDVEATNRYGGVSVTPRTWVVDLTAPLVALGSPSGSSSTGSVGFSASEAATFTCSLDGAAFSPCVSPYAYAGLGEGEHALVVRATDAAGNARASDPLRWTVTLPRPTTTITEAPAAWSNAPSAHFRFTSDAAQARFQCRLDEGAWERCDEGVFDRALPEGSYAFQVRAVQDGVVDETPAVRAFTLDRTAPSLNVVDAPGEETDNRDATITTAVDDPDAELRCALDGRSLTPCSTRITLRGITAGDHRLAIVAQDRAGNAAGVTVGWRTRSAARAVVSQTARGASRVGCDVQLVAGQVVSIDFLRDGRVVATGTKTSRALGPEDDGARLACRARVIDAGVERTIRSVPMVVMGGQRVQDLRVTQTSSGAPKLRFRAQEPGLVLVRLWCRSGSAQCVKPAPPTDWDLTARSSAASLRKYRRVLVPVRAGNNDVRLDAVLPKGLAPGTYKVTLRIARRTRDGRLKTSQFLAAALQSPPPARQSPRSSG